MLNIHLWQAAQRTLHTAQYTLNLHMNMHLYLHLCISYYTLNTTHHIFILPVAHLSLHTADVPSLPSETKDLHGKINLDLSNHDHSKIYIFLQL